jgi:DNA-binding SARP family transcriptional activator
MTNPGRGGKAQGRGGWLRQLREQRRQRLLQALSRQPRNPFGVQAREKWVGQLRQRLQEQKRSLEGARKRIDDLEKELATVTEEGQGRSDLSTARASRRTTYYGKTEEPEVSPRGSYYDVAQLQAETASVDPKERSDKPRNKEEREREADSRRKQQTKGGKGKTRS